MNPDASQTASPRIRSIDFLRGLIILVMLFVNDVAGVAGAPAWMKHFFPSEADGMTFVDIVFPAFLFIVGLSLPIAFERRLSRGESVLHAAGHILQRTVTLLVIGVMMVNTHNISPDGLLHPRLWSLLMYLSVCLIWIVPAKMNARLVWACRIVGTILLVGLAFLYRGEPNLIGLRPQWWGILGLIGWAYLVTASLYLILRRRVLAYAAAIALLYIVYLADAAGLFSGLGLITRYIGIGSMLGSHAAITASGALLSILLFSAELPHNQRLRLTLIFAAVLAAAGWMLHSAHAVHPMFIYNKNAATPPWCLLSSAWTALLFGLIYWSADARGITTGTRMTSSAGQNALFAFILGPIVYNLLGVLAAVAGGYDFYAHLGSSFATGFFRSIFFALIGIWMTGKLQQYGLALRI